MSDIEHFITGRREERGVPLERYLQLLPGNVAKEYITAYTKAGEVVLDPFAQTETLLLEGAAQGRRGIASNFNPIITLLIEGLLSLPAPREIDAATMRLGDSLKRGVPLRDHINRLYATTCPRCLEPVTAEHFLWDREEDRPVEKYYHCSHCAADGQVPVEEADLDVLGEIETHGVHYWYLLERLSQPHVPERKLAEKLLDLYTPRNLSALTDLSMKTEALFADSPLLSALQIIILHCLDTCSKLDAASIPRPTALRPSPASRFVERNVWHAFEEARRQLRQLSPPPGLTLCVSLDELVHGEAGQGVVVNEPARKLATMLPPSSVSLAVSAPRTYYRPFWTLSYLWSGWLWGREKAAVFRSLLRRKMMGWSWYRKSLSTALRSIHRPLRPKGRMVFILDTADLSHVTNLVLAAVDAGFTLARILYQPHDNHPPKEALRGVEGAYRLTFTRDQGAGRKSREPSLSRLTAALQREALRATRELLRERGEALHFSWLHSAIYQRWSRHGLLKRAVLLEGKVALADYLGEQIEAALQEGLTNGSLELLPVAPAEERVVALWWLQGGGYPTRPLGERVEQSVREALAGGADPAYDALRDRVYASFPGLFTPGPALVEECLRSYGVEDEASGRYSLRPGEEEESRKGERAETLAVLVELGHRLGYLVSLGRKRGPRGGGPRDLLSIVDRGWRPRLPKGVDVAWGGEGEIGRLFVFKQTTALGDILNGKDRRWSEGARYLVIPERRVELLRFRMEAELLLRRALIEGGWELLKLSHLRALAAKEDLERRDLAQVVGLDPLIERPEAQLRLF